MRCEPFMNVLNKINYLNFIVTSSNDTFPKFNCNGTVGNHLNLIMIEHDAFSNAHGYNTK